MIIPTFPAPMNNATTGRNKQGRRVGSLHRWKIDTFCFGQKKSEAGLELGEAVRAEGRSESIEQTSVELLDTRR